MWVLPAILAAALPSPACDPMPGWEEVARASEGRYLVLGETHGTVEAPAMLAEYVCALADNGPVLVGIEFTSTTNAAFQRAWAAPHGAFRQTLFAQVSEWGERSDGVASTAMLAMLERLHALKEAGAQIDIVAFNGANGDAQRAAFAGLPGQEPHEAAQAANIREAAQGRPYSHVVVLVGSFHAGKQAVTLGGVETRPMAMLLAERERVLSLAMHTGGGATWNCQLAVDADFDPTVPVTDDMVECASHAIAPNRTERERGFHLDSEMSQHGYDGVFALGPVTASPPPEID